MSKPTSDTNNDTRPWLNEEDIQDLKAMIPTKETMLEFLLIYCGLNEEQIEERLKKFREREFTYGSPNAEL